MLNQYTRLTAEPKSEVQAGVGHVVSEGEASWTGID